MVGLDEFNGDFIAVALTTVKVISCEGGGRHFEAAAGFLSEGLSIIVTYLL